MKALVTARLSLEAEKAFATWFDCIQYAGWRETRERLSTQELVAALQDVDVLITEFDVVTKDVLVAARKLRLLACCRGEPEANVDLRAATQCGIPVLFAPGRTATSVAEFTFGLILSLVRHISKTDYLLKRTELLTCSEYVSRKAAGREAVSEWSLDTQAPYVRYSGPELEDRTLGIVGFGRIGQEVARRALGFQMNVLICDPYVTDAVIDESGGKRSDLDTLLQEADFVTLHCKVTPETRGMIGAPELSLMKPTAFLINTARAAIVDYAALYTTLCERRIVGAAIDVFEHEPIPPDDPLLELENVVLTPHLAGASWDIPRHHSKMLMQDLSLFLQGRQPQHLANPEVWERRRQ